MPFENTLVTLKLTGAQLKTAGRQPPGGRAKMQSPALLSSGSPEGKTMDLALERNGKAIADTDEFSVVTNNYLTSGGSGGRAFNEGKDITDTMLPVRDYLIKDVKETSPLKLPAGPRFIKLD